MGAPHGDPYSVSPLGCYLHSYHLLLIGYSSFYTRLFYPPDANYEKRKVISEVTKKGEWVHFFCLRRFSDFCSRRTWYKLYRTRIRDAFHTIETWFSVLVFGFSLVSRFSAWFCRRLSRGSRIRQSFQKAMLKRSGLKRTGLKRTGLKRRSKQILKRQSKRQQCLNAS